MIKGLSYEKGIFFIGKNHISCSFNDKGLIKDWVKPITIRTLILVMLQVIKAMPIWFKIISILYFTLILAPKVILLIGIPINWSGFPFYFIFYYMFGTHFLFPKQLRKYHGAEHKVFSYKGIKTISNLNKIKQAEITNRYCSTNFVVVYFSCVVLGLILLSIWQPFEKALEITSYSSLIIAPIINSQLDRRPIKLIKKYVLGISFFLQRHITTTNPDDLHVKTAIRSYRRLALKEFPHELREKSKFKEEKKLAIADITIIPIGTNDASVSQYVASIHELLESYKDKVEYKLTPMSTIIEGELPLLFEIIQALHEVPFKKGVKRVATNIRIDDRRDKELTMSGKISSVEEKLKKEDKITKADS